MVSWALLEAVRDLVGADAVEMEQRNPERRWYGFVMNLEERWYVDEEPSDPHGWEVFWSTEACARTADPYERRIILTSDIMSDRQWRTSPSYVEHVRDSGMFHNMLAVLPDDPGLLTRLHCWRPPGRDFTERERFLLALARPHLVEAYRTARLRSRPRPDLTSRPLELLGHVGQGLTNRQVARTMGISEGTVRRHLNNIYQRLGAGSRTEAVTRVAAFGHQQAVHGP